jgi:hypothetical protein
MDQKTQFIEATLDWAEDRTAYLINQGLMEEALDLAREFHEWSRAPLGFDHDLDFPVVDG